MINGNHTYRAPMTTHDALHTPGLRMEEHRFGELGRGVDAATVFQRLRKGKYRAEAIGEIWLDGETVRSLLTRRIWESSL